MTGKLFFLLLLIAASVRPERGHTDQSIYLGSMEWAAENHFPVKGHTLAWPYRPLTPEWVFHLSPDTVEALLMKRIEQLTREFRGTIPGRSKQIKHYGETAQHPDHFYGSAEH